MVAPQILVLIVGVRILLGELRLTKSQLFFLRLHTNGRFEYRFSSPPSQGGETGSTPVVAIDTPAFMRGIFFTLAHYE